jgi:hypothetical protein
MQAIRMAVNPHQDRISPVEVLGRDGTTGSVGEGGVLDFFLDEATD